MYPVILIFITVGFWKFWKKKWVTFGILFFLIQITTVSNIIPTSRFAIIADRYMYLPSIGLFFLLGYIFNEAIQRKRTIRYLLLAFSIIYVGCLSLYAQQRSRVWKNSDTLKKELKQTITNRPDYKEWLKQNQNN
jgi:hypothetical protein